MNSPTRKPNGVWRDLPWLSLGLALLVGASWFASGGGARVVRAEGGAVHPSVPATRSAMTARRLREALGGLPLEAPGIEGGAAPGPLVQGSTDPGPGGSSTTLAEGE